VERSQAENLSNNCKGPLYSTLIFAMSRSWLEFPASVNIQQLISGKQRINELSIMEIKIWAEFLVTKKHCPVTVHWLVRHAPSLS
jgi:hypothetical protein